MSRTADYIITLQEEISNAGNLHDVLELDLKYSSGDGTATKIQDIFRQAKYDHVMKGLERIHMERDAFKFYNYSMQGYCQIYFDVGTDERLITNLAILSDEYGLWLTENEVDTRRDAVVLTLSVVDNDEE